MEKPKPGRNWRVLLTELGIIVLGVSIALGAEQAVSWANWRSEVAKARQTLRAEIAADSRSFARRIAYQPCMTRQIDEAQAMINDLRAGRSPRKYTSLHTGVSQLFSDSEWQSQRASQVLTHFPRAELSLMGVFYARQESIRLWSENEGPAWADLNVLNDPPAGLAAGDFLRLQSSLNIARRMNAIIVINSQRQLNVSRQLGVNPDPVDPKRVEKFCNTYDQAWADHLRSLGE